MLKQILTITLAVGCTACVGTWDVSELDAKLQNRPMVFFLETGEHRINGKSGFVIYMKPAIAHRMNAPNGQEFLALLNTELSIEESKGDRRFCEHGYKIVDDYTYYFRIISAECN
jgi:hypothetical protein